MSMCISLRETRTTATAASKSSAAATTFCRSCPRICFSCRTLRPASPNKNFIFAAWGWLGRSTPRPDDFDAFWDAKLAAQAKIPINPVLTKVDSGVEGVDLAMFQLDALGSKDRFNVVEFRDAARLCFPEWADVNPDTLQRAYDFIAQMKSTGNTDIFGSMRELLAMPRRAGRPVIMMVVSDGVATVGLTDRSLIIEAFSQENKGATSVFTLGTFPGVNAYLLDLLSYRNRGDTFIVRTGRWDIPNAIEKRAREVSHPVLSDVKFRFGGQTYCDAYPTLTCNLYLDRPLVLFGRFARDAKELVFQATGQADEIRCDMVFEIDLAKAMAGEKDIETNWAWQRAYHLIGEHNRTRDPAALDELNRLGKTYGIKIPYRRELSD